jgi:hypothetical protein
MSGLSQARVVRRRRIFREILRMGCHLEDYQAQLGGQDFKDYEDKMTYFRRK